MERVVNTKQKYSVISFLIFCLLVSKIIIINVFEIIPTIGPTNRNISWLVFAPLLCIGFVLSIRVLRGYIPFSLRYFTELKVILAIPMFLTGIYYLLLIIIAVLKGYSILP
jgi:hypothetical protein